MNTATIRIPEEKRNILKAISSMENRKLNEVIVELIDEYIERHRFKLDIFGQRVSSARQRAKTHPQAPAGRAHSVGEFHEP